MGTNQSTNGYSRLNPSSDNSLNKPLLSHGNKMGTNQSKTGNSRLFAPLDVPSKSLIISQENKASKPIKEEKTANPNLEKEISELKFKVEKLEIACPSHSDFRRQEKAIEALKRKNADLEKKILDLTGIINEMKMSNSQPEESKSLIVSKPINEHSLIPNLIDMDSDNFVINNNPDFGAITTLVPSQEIASGLPREDIFDFGNRSVNDLMGLLMILIFLAAVLVGLNL